MRDREPSRAGSKRRVLVGLLLAGFLLGATPLAAQAGQAVSSWGYFTVNGVAYKNQATISTSSGSAGAYTLLAKAGSGCIPSGWGGARARLFNSGNTLVRQSTIQYNSGCTVAFDVVTSRTGSGTWYSYGVTWGWNGSAYNPYYTFKSPNQSS